MIVGESQEVMVFEQKYEPPAQPIKINYNYICPLGFIRITIIVLLSAGCLAAWLIPRDVPGFYSLDVNCNSTYIYSSTRSAYIVLSSTTIAISAVFYVISITNFVNLPGFQSVNWLILINFIDVLSLLSMLAIGIAACVREAQVPPNVFTYAINRGAFASAGFFALFSVIWYIISILVSVPYLMKLLEPDEPME